MVTVKKLAEALLKANDGAVLMNKPQIMKATGKGESWVSQLVAPLVKVCGNSYFYLDVAEALIGFRLNRDGDI